MIQILLGSFSLSLIHAAIPSHWIPLVAIGKSENWSRPETLMVTAIAGFAHTLSTILFGILVGLLGYKLSASYAYVTKIIAPVILTSFGIFYLIADLKGSHRRHQHLPESPALKSRSKLAIIASLSFAMFFTPCLEIEVYYFTAGIHGWQGIIIVSSVYMVVTVLGMLLLVYLGTKGVEKIEFHFLEHHEKLITGAVLIGLGVVTYFINI